MSSRGPDLSDDPMTDPPFPLERLLAAKAGGCNMPAVRGPDGELTYDELRARVLTAAGGLRALGLEPGDAVLVALRPGVTWLTALLGAWTAGLRTMLIPPGEGAESALPWFDGVPIRGVFLEEEDLSRLAPQVKARPAVHTALVHGAPDLEGVQGLDIIFQGGEYDGPLPTIDQDAVIAFSAGTLLPSRAVVLSHSNLAHAATAFLARLRAARAERSPAILALPQVGATLLTLILAVLDGEGTVVLVDPEARLWEVAEGYDGAWAAVTPSQLGSLSTTRNDDELLDNRAAWLGEQEPADESECGSAVMRFVAVFGDALDGEGAGVPPVAAGFDFTAAAGPVSWSPPGACESGSCGRPLEGIEIELRPPGGRGYPGTGEVLLRGPQVARSVIYPEGGLEDPTGEDGWLRTGDLAETAPNGCLTLVGRMTRLLRRGEEWHALEGIEEALHMHPRISEAVVTFVGPTEDQVLKAFVVPTSEEGPSRQFGAKQVLEHLKEQIPHFLAPKYVAFVEELPRNAQGRIALALLK